MPGPGLETGIVVRNTRVTTLHTSRTVRRGRRRFKLSTKSTRWPASAKRRAMCCLLVHRGVFHVAVDTSTKSTAPHPAAGKLINHTYLKDAGALGDGRLDLNAACENLHVVGVVRVDDPCNTGLDRRCVEYIDGDLPSSKRTHPL